MEKRICRNCGVSFVTDHPTKAFCSRECTITWHSRNSNAQRRDMRSWEGICPVCHKTFAMLSHRRKYCSDQCKERDRQRRRKIQDPYHKICKVCGAPFDTMTNRRVNCERCTDRKSHRGIKRVSAQDRHMALEAQGNICWLCKQPLVYQESVGHHLDGLGHMENPCNGLENLVALHKDCHAMFHRVHLVYRDGHWGVDGRIFGILGTPSLAVMYSGR